MLISSLQNGRIKNVIKLGNRRQRDSQRLTVVEGAREVERALVSGIVPREAFICDELVDDEGEKAVALLHELATTGRTDVNRATLNVFEKMAYRGKSGGLLMTVPYWGKSLEQLDDPSFVVVVEGGEKPGNLGAILRTADAAGVDALILCGAGTDMHNPNAIRASLGAIFSVAVVQAETTAVIAYLQQNNFKSIAATPAAEDVYYNVEMGGKTAVIMGSESDGLTDEWLAAADVQVAIPMHGIVDSLNLSVSTALLLYEVVRQKEIVNC